MIRSNPYNSRQVRYYAPVRSQFELYPVDDERLSNFEQPLEPEYNPSDLVDLSNDAHRSRRPIDTDVESSLNMSDRSSGLVIDISSDEEDDLYTRRTYRAESATVPINGECTRQNCDSVSCSSRQSIAEVCESLRVGDELNVRSGGDIDSVHVINTIESARLLPNVSRRDSLPIISPPILNMPCWNFISSNDDQPINLSNRLKRPGESVMILNIIGY